MNSTKALILGVLVVALAGLGGLFYMSQKNLDAFAQMQKEANDAKIRDTQAKEYEEMKRKVEEMERLANQTNTQAPPLKPIGDMAQDAETEAWKQRALAAERKNAMSDVAREENQLLSERALYERDKIAAMAKLVDKATVVGKVLDYDKQLNILVFKPVGQPSLVNGQELALRRRSAILVYLVIDELDVESGAYIARLKLDEYFSGGADVDVAPITPDEEIIIPPDELKSELPPLEDYAPKKPNPSVGAGTNTTSEPSSSEHTPWSNIEE